MSDPRFAPEAAQLELIKAFNELAKKLNKSRPVWTEEPFMRITPERLNAYLRRLHNAIVFATPSCPDEMLTPFFETRDDEEIWRHETCTNQE